jgi:uncharacterized membrane protein YbhN (UPF0104 family)
VQLPNRAAVLRLVRAVVVLGIAWSLVVLLAVLAWGGEALASPPGTAVGAFALATLLSFATNHALRFLRWHMMLRAEGCAPRWGRSLSIFLAGLALLPTPAKAGVAVRSLLLLGEGVPVHVSLAAYFVERLTDLIGLVMLASLLLGMASGPSWAVPLLIGLAGLLLVLSAPAILQAWQPDTVRRPRLAGAIAWMRRLFVDAAEMMAGWRLPVFVAIGAVANAATGLLLWFMLSTNSAADQAAATGIVAVSHLSGSLSLLPGGIGGFEAAMLAQLQVLEVPIAHALVALAAVRLATLWGSVAVGLPLLLNAMRRLRFH